MRANHKLGSQILPSIGQDMVLKLSKFNLLFQVDMQLVKVNSKAMNLRGSEVLFGVDRDVQVVSFVCKEG